MCCEDDVIFLLFSFFGNNIIVSINTITTSIINVTITMTIDQDHPHHPNEGGAHDGGEESVGEQRPPFHHQFEVLHFFSLRKKRLP